MKTKQKAGGSPQRQSLPRATGGASPTAVNHSDALAAVVNGNATVGHALRKMQELGYPVVVVDRIENCIFLDADGPLGKVEVNVRNGSYSQLFAEARRIAENHYIIRHGQQPA